jgi:hypothetical protein
VHLGANESTRSPWSPISEETVLEALRIILDESNYPLHVMDHQGSHRTGTVLGCLRKAQRWSLTSIFDEYRRYAGPKVRLANEQFIELFDTDLVNGKFTRCIKSRFVRRADIFLLLTFSRSLARARARALVRLARCSAAPPAIVVPLKSSMYIAPAYLYNKHTLFIF